MITRRTFIRSLAIGAIAFFTGNLFADESKLDAESLKYELEAKGTVEETFIETVVAMRDKNIIPEKYLYSSYKYAMRKPKNRFAYFARAITKICKDAGITIPVPYESKKVI